MLRTASPEESAASESLLSGYKGEEEGGFESVGGKATQSKTGTCAFVSNLVANFFIFLVFS